MAVHGVMKSWMTERLHFHFSLSCIEEGNGNPLQCPCLENPRDGGAWWAAIYGAAQSWTGLKRLNSSSSNKVTRHMLDIQKAIAFLYTSNRQLEIKNFLSSMQMASKIKERKV